MGGLKAPRADGFQGLNATHIVLIPKVLNPELNAFVGGWQIQENIGIAHELFHFLKLRKTKSKFELGIKFDMHKAYDRVEWDFLNAVMKKMGFHPIWRTLIMGCMCLVNFAVILNGQPGNKYDHSRGLRQGDPLSSYLFLMVSDVLSNMISTTTKSKQLQGVWMCAYGPPISHIFFVDDTLIFLKANKANCSNLGRLLETYCLASGQAMNLHKSCVYFSANSSMAIMKELGSDLGIPMVFDPGTYLGLPAIWGSLKCYGLAYVKGCLLGKIQG
ncbi:hypothetical protein ACFX2B_003303 [Malus domestica]